MKLPRDISGDDLVKGFRRVGYEVVRQRGHVRMTTQQNGEHHISIPMHSPVKTGTLANILESVALHLGTTRDDLLERMKL